jgi:hypothetical protein
MMEPDGFKILMPPDLQWGGAIVAYLYMMTSDHVNSALCNAKLILGYAVHICWSDITPNSLDHDQSIKTMEFLQPYASWDIVTDVDRGPSQVQGRFQLGHCHMPE